MILEDCIWGVKRIDEPVLHDLIDSASVQRLKEISHQGLPQEYYPRNVFSRYDHSVGVFLTLRKVGADLTTQIAGLLHDVSHTAFSHVADWVFGDPTKDDYQDKSHLKVIKNSELPKILKKHKIDYRTIVNPADFPLLDNEVPQLCADRFDYGIREIFNTYDYSPLERKTILENLSALNGTLLFNNSDSADFFANRFLDCQREIWDSEDGKVRYYLFSKILKSALREKIISKKDFRKTDGEIIEKLKNKGNSYVERLNSLKDGFSISHEGFGTPVVLRSKVRYVDPLVDMGSGPEKLSDISGKFAKRLKEFRESYNGEPRRVYIESV